MPSKNVSYSAIVTFQNLKWLGSSNKANFKLSASTILNIGENSSSNYDTLINNIEQYSIKDLYNLVINGSILPLSTGNKIASDTIKQLLSMSEDLSAYQTENILTEQVLLDPEQITKSMNLFSNTYSFYKLIKSILRAGSKTVVTDKMYISSSVKNIQVL